MELLRHDILIVGGGGAGLRAAIAIGEENPNLSVGVVSNQVANQFAHLRQGYRVYPVNPKGEPIEGVTTYRRLADVPETHLTRISVYLPPEVVLQMLDQVAATSHDELWLNPGTESATVLRQAAQLGLDPIQACSIVDLGINPRDMSATGQ